jgi:hypothetical protein
VGHSDSRLNTGAGVRTGHLAAAAADDQEERRSRLLLLGGTSGLPLLDRGPVAIELENKRQRRIEGFGCGFTPGLDPGSRIRAWRCSLSVETRVSGLFRPRPRPLTMGVRERGRGPNRKEDWWWTGEVDSEGGVGAETRDRRRRTRTATAAASAGWRQRSEVSGGRRRRVAGERRRGAGGVRGKRACPSWHAQRRSAT